MPDSADSGAATLAASPAEGPSRFVSRDRSTKIQTGFQRYQRPVYDYPTKYSPCRAGCPAGHDIAWALYLAGQDRFDLAYATFKEDSPFPSITGRVCYHPCEAVCNRGDHDSPLAINALERTFDEYGRHRCVEPPAFENGYSVGIIGAGPAGLTCAYHLRQMGYAVIVYDKNDRPGGVLTYGIPAYRLPREIVDREVEDLIALGVQFELGCAVGSDVSFQDLRARHDSLFLGIGLGRPRELDCKMPDTDRIMPGIGFLYQASTGSAPQLHGHVVVIGGGDVAIDCARSARRLGAAQVTVCSLEARRRMPAHPAEMLEAEQEGTSFLDRVAPSAVELIGDTLQVTFAEVKDAARNADGSMKYRANGSLRESVAADFILYAIGQRPDCSFLPSTLRTERALQTDRFGFTNVKGVFAAGDIAGTYNVVNAIGSAKRVAIGIDGYLMGRSLDGVYEQIRVGGEGAVSMKSYHAMRQNAKIWPSLSAVRIRDINLDYFPAAPRQPIPHLAADERVHSFDEVNRALGRAEALQEAARCFNCGACNMCGNCFTYCPDSSVIQTAEWGFEIDLDHCKGCGVCVEECPRDAMEMTPESEALNAGPSV